MRVLLEERGGAGERAPGHRIEPGTRGTGRRAGRRSSHGKRPVGALVVQEGQADLLQVVGALGPASGLRADCTAGRSNAIEHGDDRDHNQQLDQGKSAFSASKNPVVIRRRKTQSDSRKSGPDRRRDRARKARLIDRRPAENLFGLPTVRRWLASLSPGTPGKCRERNQTRVRLGTGSPSRGRAYPAERTSRPLPSEKAAGAGLGHPRGTGRTHRTRVKPVTTRRGNRR